MEDYQKRVVDEKKELDEKIKKLSFFLSGKMIKSVSDEEKTRLENQKKAMREYSDILEERISNFAK